MRDGGDKLDGDRRSGDVRWSVPFEFRKGELRGVERDLVSSGRNLLLLLDGLRPLAASRVLDWGCGCKLAQAFYEYDIEVLKYVGVDVDQRMIEYLAATNPLPGKLEFHWRDLRNALYNPDGTDMGDALGEEDRFPVGGFELETLFSVFTHMTPDDTQTLLAFLRTRIAEKGLLVFTAFVDEASAVDFYDREPARPLLRATYRKAFLERMLEETGWRIQQFSYPAPEGLIAQPHYVCSPA